MGEFICRRIAGEYLLRTQNTDYILHAYYWGAVFQALICQVHALSTQAFFPTMVQQHDEYWRKKEKEKEENQKYMHSCTGVSF